MTIPFYFTLLLSRLCLFSLTDIDECERDHNCDVNSHCKNTVGSFDCRCIDGFTGNGTNCYG